MTKDFQPPDAAEPQGPLSDNAPAESAAVHQVSVDWDELAMAFENQLEDMVHFLDLRTGEVVALDGGRQPEPAVEKKHFLQLEPRPSREGYRTMKQFIQTVEDPQLRRELEDSLVGRGAFRRFKDRLLAYPQERQRWFAFKDAAVFEYARCWLKDRGVQILNPPPRERTPLVEPETAKPPAGLAPESDFSAVIAPYERPGLVFQPRRSALLVIDMQRAFVDPGASAYLPTAAGMARRLARLLEAWRRAQLPVFFTRHVHCYPQRDGGAMARWWRSLILEGTREAEISPLLAPLPGEPVVNKCRYGAFSGTALEAMLRAGGVEDLVIGGVMTNLCCETTAREAFMRDFNVFFLGDGTATSDETLHQASLRNIAYGFGRVLSCQEALGIVEKYFEEAGVVSHG